MIGSAALAAATLLAVLGCAPSSPADAGAGAGHVPSYAQTLAQAKGAFTGYVDASTAAAAAGDDTTGLADVADAQWFQVKAQYLTLANAGVAVPRYSYGSPQFYLPAPAAYPRWFAVAVDRGTTVSAHVGPVLHTIMVFEQTKADKPWTLDGTAVLDQPLPEVARRSDGYAVAAPPADPSVWLRPDVVGPAQAAVVDQGPANPSAAVITPGPLTTGLYTAQSAQARAEKARGLVYQWLLLGQPFPQFQLRLQDGGDLVLYGMNLDTFTEHPNLVKGSPIPVPAGFTPLLAAPTEVGYHEVYAYWTDQFAAIDPATTAAHGRVSIIGFSSGPSYGHAY